MKNREYRIHKLYLLVFVLILSVCAVQLRGQRIGPNWQPQSVTEQSLAFEVKKQGTQLIIQSDQAEDSIAAFQLGQPYLDDADLIVPYTSHLPKGDFAARVSIRIHHTTYGNLASEELILFGVQSGTITFRDMTENKLYLNESYQLLIQLETAYTGDCNSLPPPFGIRQQIAPAGLCLLGLAGMGVGELILRPRQKKAYERYVLAWEQERLSTDGEPWLKEAQTIKEQRRFFTYGGSILAIGGAIWYGLRHRNYAKRKRRYETYCLPQDQTSLQPALTPTPFGETLGLSLKISF